MWAALPKIKIQNINNFLKRKMQMWIHLSESLCYLGERDARHTSPALHPNPQPTTWHRIQHGVKSLDSLFPEYY